MKKRIVLCADDYGQALAISQGIIHLIQHNRLSATSCMVNTLYWFEHAKWLMPYQAQIDIGLHFNLTTGQPLSREYAERHGDRFFKLPILLSKAFLRQLNGPAIEAECHAQLDAFQDAMGFLPRHIDGHQHIHQFPIIREALMRVYEKRLREHHAYVRLVNESIKIRDLFYEIKKIVIHATGTQALKRLLVKHQIPYNQTFAGVYAFAKADHYTQLFPSFLSKIGDKGLILCHPGLASSEASDEIANARYAEYQYLASSQFLDDCKAGGVVLERFFMEERVGERRCYDRTFIV